MFMRMAYDEKLAEAAYLIGCQRTGEAVVIDPNATSTATSAWPRSMGSESSPPPRRTSTPTS
ncbi:MAG: hypothetical protein ACO3DS_06955 [Phycisphaerales bacterium]